MSNPFEVNSQNDVENEARKTVDSSWDSPFHTLGKGATQAAPGNHNHPENLTPDELIAGNNITLNKNADGSVTIHGADPGDPITDHGALSNRNAADQHSIGSVTGLQTALNGKAASSHTHTDYATSGHNHSGVYAPNSHTHAYAPSSHSHSPGQVGIGYGESGSFSLDGDAKGTWNVGHNLGRQPVAVTAVAVFDGGVQSIVVSVDSWTSTYVTVNARNMNASAAETFRLHVIVVG